LSYSHTTIFTITEFLSPNLTIIVTMNRFLSFNRTIITFLNKVWLRSRVFAANSHHCALHDYAIPPQKYILL
jgi:hypothetical protein